MTQKTSPFVETKYGWDYGESGWNIGMDEDLLKFSYLFNKNIDGIVSSLPAVVNGTAYYLTSDKRVYFGADSAWYSAPIPKWFTLVIKSTGQPYQFNGIDLVAVDSVTDIDARLDAVEGDISTLGTAAYVDVSTLATTSQLDIASSQANGYTDTLRDDLAAISSAKGSSLVGNAVVSVSSIYNLCTFGSYRTDAIYRVVSWYSSTNPSTMRGGGDYIYVPSINKSSHNGGYIISPTVPITASNTSTPAFLAGTGETDPSGTGCLVRITSGDIYAEYFGLIDDVSYPWNCKSFNAAIKWADVVAPDISPGTVRFMDGEFRTTDPVILHRPLGQTGRLPGFKGAGSYNSAIVKTTNNTTGSAYPWLDIDAAVIELPPDGNNNYLSGADSGGFQVRKLANDQTGYGYYATRSYFGRREDMFIRGFNRGFTSIDCWMGQPDKIWAFDCNVGFTMSGTSNHGGNLYASGSREIGFDLGGLTYSNLSCACDSTGAQGTIPKIAYKLSGCHGIKLTCGVEKTVGEEFNISNCFGIEINGHSFSTNPSTVVTQKVNVTNSTVKMTFDWNLSMGNLSAADKLLYPKLFIKDVRSTLDFTGCNFGDTDARMPRVQDGGNYLSTVEMAPHRNSDGVVTHRMLLSPAVYKQAIYVGSSSRIKFEGGLCADGAADVQFEPTVPLGYAVSSIGTTEGTATDIGSAYNAGVASAARLKGYVSGGWLYLLGPVGFQRNMVFKFFTAPLA